jgi:hypothetical protein
MQNANRIYLKQQACGAAERRGLHSAFRSAIINLKPPQSCAVGNANMDRNREF